MLNIITIVFDQLKDSRVKVNEIGEMWMMWLYE